MAKSRRSRAGGRTRDTAAKAVRVIEQAATIPKRLDARIQPFAVAAGWCGVAGLLWLAWLSRQPSGDWPFGMERARLAVYVTVALVMASLLGWSFMQQGQAKIERRIGRGAALWLFGILPVAAAAITLADQHLAIPDAERAEWSTVFLVARWYSPAAVVASLWMFLEGKSRRAPQFALHLALLLPFAALLGAVVFGFHVPFVDESLRETLRTLGAGAIALQILLAWFVGGTG